MPTLWSHPSLNTEYGGVRRGGPKAQMPNYNEVATKEQVVEALGPLTKDGYLKGRFGPLLIFLIPGRTTVQNRLNKAAGCQSAGPPLPLPSINEHPWPFVNRNSYTNTSSRSAWTISGYTTLRTMRRSTRSREQVQVGSTRHGRASKDMAPISEGPPKSMTHTFFATPTPASQSDPTLSLSSSSSSTTLSFRVSDQPSSVSQSTDSALANTTDGKRRETGRIPRPPNAFILFRSSFIRNHTVPDSVEANHSNLSKIAGMFL
ncbi:hypothetical protein DL96DRAFT_441388 [Flagelloscypha sp. PMI_526]|nr:hypothetical protein DL96DRAFT_441388 [Flagelloscypha sp. PMI_526]